jgi:predicted esterase
MTWLTRLKVAGLLGVTVIVAAATVPGLPTGLRGAAADPDSPAATGKLADVRRAAAELHVVGVYGAKQFSGGEVAIDVRHTARPVVLALTSYYPVTWRVRPAPGARVEKVVVSGYFAQELVGLPPGVPVVNRSYFPDDGSRRAGGWFYAYKWNSSQYREVVRRLNEMTGLPVASFQEAYEGTAFVIDDKRGRERAQGGMPPQAPPAAPPTAAALRAAAAGGQLHVVGVYSQGNASRPVDVEVRATPNPVVLALTAYDSVVWNVKVAPGARISAVVASGYFPQEIDGVPAGVPFYRSGPDPSSHFGGRAGPRAREYFYAYEAGTDEYRRTASALEDLTGLRIATFQGENAGTAFVVDGTRGVPAQAGAGTAGPGGGAKAEDPPADVADVPSRDLKVGGDADKRYFLIGPRAGAKPAPVGREGYGLLVVLPGGDGGPDFLPFVKRVCKNAVPEGYLVAQVVAPRWAADQRIVWPTASNPVAKLRFSTEELVEAVVGDVAAAHGLDRSRVFALAWSSGGPAAYAASLRERGSVTGSLVGMSVFQPKFLPPLAGAKGRAFYLYHSREDRLCPYRMAEEARDRLKEHGAAVRLATYEGGHGWRGDVYGDIRAGLRWLEASRKDGGRR